MARTSGDGPEPVEPWTEVRVEVPLGWQELVAEVLAPLAGGAAAVGLATIGTRPPAPGRELVRVWLPRSRDGAAARARIQEALARLAGDTGARELTGLGASFRELPPEDWATSWRKVWKPFRVGRLAVLPPWDPAPRRPSDRVLVLRPGSVFGSGRHATTRTCLRLLQDLPLAGARVVDAGTGSGILAVAAALLGARSVVGFDLDPNAPPEARRLALRNGAAALCRFEQEDFARFSGAGRVDVFLGNLYHDVWIDQAERLADGLAAGGRFLVSGITLAHRAEVEGALARAGLRVERGAVRGRWVTLAGAAPAPAGGVPPGA